MARAIAYINTLTLGRDRHRGGAHSPTDALEGDASILCPIFSTQVGLVGTCWDLQPWICLASERWECFLLVVAAIVVTVRFFSGGRVVVSDDLQCLLDPECWVA